GWWQCHGSPFETEEITRELEEYADKGMGGIVIKDTWEMSRDDDTAHIPNIPIMSETWLDMFGHIVSECQRLGIICRSRFGSGWNAGGPWVSSAESSQIAAFVQSSTITGPTTWSGTIPNSSGRPTYEALQTSEGFVLAVRSADGMVIDLTSQVQSDLSLSWEVPVGDWVILSSYSKASGVYNMSTSTSGRGLHHDHLSNAGTDLQIANVAQKMLDEVGDFTNTGFDGFDTDSWEMGNPTWTPGFRQAFIDRRGYDPVPYLPIMAGFSLGPNDNRFVYDFRTTVSDLIVETHYKRLCQWCKDHGIAAQCEAAGGPSHTVPKDLLKAVGAANIPMGELWMHGRAYVKIPASAAHAYGKRLVSLEWITQPVSYFAPASDWIKYRSDEAFLLGGNSLCSSCVNYSPPEAGLPGWVHATTTRIDHTTSWWPLARSFFDYMGRCSFMLQSGEPMADVAVYRNFQTAGGELWYANADDNLDSLSKNYALDYVNDDIVQNLMSTENGRIVLPSGAAYQILYIYPLPGGTMPLETLAKIRDLAYQGATVVWAGSAPSHCPGLTGYPACDTELQFIADDLWSSGTLTTMGSHSYEALTAILESSPNPPSWKTTGDPPLRFVHRRTDKADIFFVVNRSSTVHVQTSVTFRASQPIPELWIPETGTIERADYQTVADGMAVAVDLPPRCSVFVVFAASGAPSAQTLTYPPAPAPLALDGSWDVAFPQPQGPYDLDWGVPATTTFPALQSWHEMTDEGIKYFNGVATYTKSFTITAPLTAGPRVVLDLGVVKDYSEISLNGQFVGGLWHPPYEIDITNYARQGANTLEVKVAKTWHNRLVRDAQLPAEQRVTRMTPESRYDRYIGKSLIEAGLIGPVQVIFEPAPVAGDIEPDGDLDFDDYRWFARAWLTRPLDAGWNSACDVSSSSRLVVDLFDISVFAQNWLLTGD
ncbi:MAG: hypothetical protein JW709_04740, partial [Sedimentisphaerales bacterium]|nr:hypothetical protein [Sedimentisphaerales bacterium]